MAIKRIVVVGGGGVMGSGISQVVAGAGFDVTMVEVDSVAAERGLARIEASFARLEASGRMAVDEVAATRTRLSASTNLEESATDADHVIESVIEDLPLKIDILRRLDAICREDVIFASNTSQFAISKLAAATTRPERVIGSHWFNPPQMMGVIELIRGVETSEETLATAEELAQRYGKQTIVCKKDTPGFITSRLIALLVLESARIVEEGIADVDDVNKACVLAFNHALGPLDTADLSGLDVVVRVADEMVEHYGERFRVPQNLRALVNAGHHGRKSGRGFRDYSEQA
jgi:3-hydroxybutyryl-CoA dehydrogenase